MEFLFLESEDNSSNSKLESVLNGFLADEFITASQYFLNKQVAKGKALEHTENNFDDSSKDEIEHFEKISNFMQATGMKINANLEDFMKNTAYPFQKIKSEEETKTLIEMMIKSEDVAIAGYEKFLKGNLHKKYPDLFTMIGDILNEEREHKKELEDILSSIK